ncbi:MAG: ATP synthase F1 subunit delta [Phycisphaerae bacterium]
MAGENQQERKKLGSTYALALYDLASEQGLLDTVREQLNVWKELLARNPELIHFFDSVLATAEDREKFLQQFQNDFHPLSMNFLGVMNHRDRLGILPAVIQAFAQEDDRRNKRVKVKLWTAVPIDEHLRQDIMQTLQKYLQKEPIVDHQIRPEILGGFVARAGDLLIDGSVKTRLSTLQKNLLRRGEDEIQSGRDFISNQA